MQIDADPNLIVYFNGQFIPLAEARIGILTHALHYGTGVFEGIRAHWNAAQRELFALRPLEHYERWVRNCRILHIEVPLTPRQLTDVTLELMRRNNLRTNIYIRPIAFKSAERVGVLPDDNASFAVVALPFGEYLHAENGIHAGVSAWRRIEDHAIPARGKICGAYVNSVLATEDARRAGFDEAILLNESGHVAEGSTCNIFVVRRGKLLTPPVYDNVLEGITRDCVMQLARRELRLEVRERSIDLSELLVADEVFFTGTAVGIAPIVRINHRPVHDAAIGPVARAIQQLYTDAALGRLREYRNWIVPVYQLPVEAEKEYASLAGLRA